MQMLPRLRVILAIRVIACGVLLWLASALLFLSIGFAIGAGDTPVIYTPISWLYRAELERASNVSFGSFVLADGGATYLLLSTGFFAWRLHRAIRAFIALTFTVAVSFGCVLLSLGTAWGPVLELEQAISVWIRRLV